MTVGRRTALALLPSLTGAVRGATAASDAGAAGYPDRPVRVVVPLTAGGSVDLLTRALARRLSEDFGQPVVIENKPGGTTVIGAQLVARAAPDGYTLLSGSSSVELNRVLMPRLPYDPQRDLTPVALLATIPFVLVVNAGLPVRSLTDLVAHARANPGALSYASYGAGGPGHLSGELFNRMAGVDTLHVPYPGIPPALVDVIAGRVSMIFSTFPLALPEIASGRLRALAVTSAERVPALPDVPTAQEAGLAGYESSGWNVLHAPGGAASAVVERLNAAVIQALADRALRAVLTDQGFVVAPPLTPGGVRAFTVAAVGRWERVIQEAGIRL